MRERKSLPTGWVQSLPTCVIDPTACSPNREKLAMNRQNRDVQLVPQPALLLTRLPIRLSLFFSCFGRISVRMPEVTTLFCAE